MARRNSTQKELLAEVEFDPLRAFTSALAPKQPWDSIEEFACHPSFCGQKLYPRQRTLLKLIYLETENMTAYDLDVIEQWRHSFMDPDTPEGVQEDIWERVEYLKARGYRHFPHIEAIIGRRGSKGKIGGILGAEKLAYMYSLGNWQDYYGVSPGKDGYLSVVATNSIQAKKFQFADIRETVEGCKYLQRSIATASEYELVIRTPADLERIAYLHQNRMPIDHRIATLHAVAMSSNSASGRGATGFANFFDEFAHMITGTGSNRSSEEVYEAYQPSLDQFGQDSLTYIPSSPFTKVGHFYSLYEQGRVLMANYDPDTGTRRVEEKTAKQLGYGDGDAEEKLTELTANPEMLIVQLPSWGLYEDWHRAQKLIGVNFKRPIQAYDDRMKRLEKANPEKFAVERRSQFASVLNAFLNPRKVDAMFGDVEWRDRIVPQERGRMDIPYRIHCDPGLSNANFALCVGHVEEAPPDEHGEVWPHVIVDYLKVWKPTDFEDHTIDYVLVQKQIAELLRRFPSTTEITFDDWNSAGMIAALKQEFGPKGIDVRVEHFTETSNQVRMDRMKSAINLGWVHSYRDDFFGENGDCLLELEAKFLQRKTNGRVDRQEFGPVTTKDLFDAVNVVVDDLLGDALDRWQSRMLGITKPGVGSTDVAGVRSGRSLEALAALKGSGGNGRPMTARERLAGQSLENAIRRRAGLPTGGARNRLRGW